MENYLNKLCWLVLVSLLLTFAGCNKSEVTPGYDIYLTGRMDNGKSNWVATYWKNGSPVELTDGEFSANIHAIAVSGKNVYTAGYQSNDLVQVGAYWKNAQHNPITHAANYGYAYGIAAINNDVYVTGHDGYKAAYWINGVKIPLSDLPSAGMGIVVVGNDVYIGGYEYIDDGGKNAAVYWKNGELFPLPSESKDAYGTSIAIDDGDVYVAGYYGNATDGYVALYWKNGVAVPLSPVSNRAQANAIIVVGNDVYVAGMVKSEGSNAVATYWKNGEAVSLPGYENANSIAVKDNDVYVVVEGADEEKATVLKNGKVYFEKFDANVYSVLIHKR